MLQHKMAIMALFSPLKSGTIGTQLMNLNGRFANGLAWAGLALVVGVPTLDFALSRISDPASFAATEQSSSGTQGSQPLVLGSSTVKAGVDPVVTASTGPRKVTSGRPQGAMPDYISGEEAEVVPIEPAPRRSIAATGSAAPQSEEPKIAATEAKPVVVQNTVPAREDPKVAATQSKPVLVQNSTAARPTVVQGEVKAASSGGTAQPGVIRLEVAAVEPAVELVAPIPLPRSARPNWTKQDFQIGDERPADPDELIVPEDEQFASSDEVISAEELDEWESGPLSDFLSERRRERPRADRRAARRDNDFDSDGFFLDEGPNRDRGGSDDFFFPIMN